MPTLHELEPEQLARIGVFYLEEAVLDVLYKVRRDGGGWILPSKVSHQKRSMNSSDVHSSAPFKSPSF